MELKPCPFCGCLPISYNTGYIECSNDQCWSMPSVHENHVDDAIAMWNTRHNPLEAEVAELREALEVCREALRENLSMFAYKNEQE